MVQLSNPATATPDAAKAGMEAKTYCRDQIAELKKETGQHAAILRLRQVEIMLKDFKYEEDVTDEDN